MTVRSDFAPARDFYGSNTKGGVKLLARKGDVTGTRANQAANQIGKSADGHNETFHLV